MQYTGVANRTSTGRPWAIASAIVHSWSSGSGIGSPPWARESIETGFTPLESRVRFSVFRAFCPGAGQRRLILHGEVRLQRHRANGVDVRLDRGASTRRPGRTGCPRPGTRLVHRSGSSAPGLGRRRRSSAPGGRRRWWTAPAGARRTRRLPGRRSPRRCRRTRPVGPRRPGCSRRSPPARARDGSRRSRRGRSRRRSWRPTLVVGAAVVGVVGPAAGAGGGHQDERHDERGGGSGACHRPHPLARWDERPARHGPLRRRPRGGATSACVR